jgi:hypothetical protein
MLSLLHKGSQPVSRETQGLATYLVPLGRLVDNSYQPRQYNDPDHVLGIAKSLIDLQPTLPETRGLQQVPMGRIVRWADSWQPPAGDYDNPDAIRGYIADPQYVVEMAFGHSRRLAFDVLAAGVKSIFPQLEGTEQVLWNGREFDPATYADMPIVLVPLTDTQLWQQAIVENAARRDISAIEKAQALQRATSELGMTITDAAASMDMSRSAASNLLRLLELPEEYQQAIVNGVLSETHGRTLLALKEAWHLVKRTPAELGAMPRKTLEEHVAGLIVACEPLAPKKNTKYKMRSWGSDLDTRSFDPHAWPYDWQAPADGDIVGPCEGCRWNVTFSGENGPRCTHQWVGTSQRACHVAKDRAWARQQAEQQAQAIQRPAAPTVSRETPAGSDRIDQSMTEHTSTVPTHTSTPAPAANVFVPDKPSETPNWFTKRGAYGEAPGVLIEKGMCSAEQCKCFVVAYHERAGDEHFRPDPEHAPNMCYGCTSAQRLARRRQELEHGDMTAKRAAVKAQNSACMDLLRDAFYRMTAQDIWHNTAFMRDLFRADSFTTYATKNQIDTLDALTIQERIWMHVAKGHCTSWSQFQVDGDSQQWDMKKTQIWLKKIGAEFAQPKGGVWAELLQPETPADTHPEEIQL